MANSFHYKVSAWHTSHYNNVNICQSSYCNISASLIVRTYPSQRKFLQKFISFVGLSECKVRRF